MIDNLQIVIYGAGNLGKLAKKYFDDVNVKYQFIVDSNPADYENDEFWNGYYIHKLEDIPPQTKRNCLFVVCITNHSFNKIKRNLKNKGCLNVIAFYALTEKIAKDHPLSNGWTYKYNNEIEEKINKVFHALKDVDSKKHYMQFAHWHRHLEEIFDDQISINCNNRFFIPELILTNHETFIDAGAYDGRVSKTFKYFVNNEFDAIYMFEPDNENLHKIKINDKKVFIYNNALGDKNINTGFLSGYDFYSKIKDDEKELTEMRTLDSFDIKPTFIKYHLEGYELQAIKGSINTIKKCRPIIAVTTYHSFDGLYEIPLYLIENLTKYNYIWRNHSYQGQGSVLYCIPKER